MDKSYFLRKFVEEILKNSNKKAINPVSIICNGYEFDFCDENLGNFLNILYLLKIYLHIPVTFEHELR